MIKNYSITAIVGLLAAVCFPACENRDVNHEDGPNFSEIHEELTGDHFDEVIIDGNVYFILERDRNNPHEGFGFMAMKANKTVENQDSIKAYLKTLLDIQIQLLAEKNRTSVEESNQTVNDLFNFHLANSNSKKIENKKAEE